MSTLWRTGCLVLALSVVVGQMAHAEEPVAAAPAKDAEVTPPAPQAAALPAAAESGFFADYPLHGFLRSRYKARWTRDASDQDLYETLSLDLGDPDRNRVTAHFLGDVSADIDGSTSNRGNFAYDSARDSTGTNIVPLVYSAYLDIHRVGPLGILRVGRQSIYETPEISFFDGLRAETKELGSYRVKLGVYGGAPVHLYEGNEPGDYQGGAYTEGHLWHGSRVRVDVQQLEGYNGGQRYRNTVTGLGAWQSLGEYIDLHAHYTRLDGEDRDVLARGTFNHPEWDFRFQASFYQLLQSRRNAVIEADAFYPILKECVPYREYRGMVSKGLGDHVNVDAGLDLRRLTHEEQASDFNHEYDRYFANLDVVDLLVKGSSVSLTGEKWVSSDRESESQGVDITCPIAEKSKVSLGTAHYLYKYDYYSDQERDDVQTYYLKLQHKYSKALRLSVNYDFEDDGSAHYNELRCEAICSF